MPADPEFPDQAAFAADLLAREAAGALLAPPDPDEPPDEIFAPDWFDSYDLDDGLDARIAHLEWELYGAESQDEAEAALLADRAPAWMTSPPGGELAVALEQVRCRTETPTALIEVMKAAERLVGWAQSVKLDAMASFMAQRRGEAAANGWVRGTDQLTGRPMDPDRSAACEVAAALRLSPHTVGGHLETAERLARDLRSTRAALRTGVLTFPKALAVVESTAHLPDEAQQQVEQRVLPRAGTQTQTQLRASLRRAIAQVDPRDHAERHRAAIADRACRKHPLPDGMAGIWLTHSADRIEAAWTAIQSLADLAKTGQTDQGGGVLTAEQRRADAMVDVFGAILASGTDWLGRTLPDQQRRRPHIEVVVPASTLLGLDDEPAELTGYGPIPADVARRIASEGTWRRILTDPATGIVLEAATTRHDPPAQVSETLLARHPICNWFCCTRPARQGDRDHGRKYKDTGTTLLEDLRPYCEYHHLLKDDGKSGWIVENLPDGTTRFTTPTGHVYRTRPVQVGPVLPPESQPTPEPPDPDPPPF